MTHFSNHKCTKVCSVISFQTGLVDVLLINTISHPCTLESVDKVTPAILSQGIWVYNDICKCNHCKYIHLQVLVSNRPRDETQSCPLSWMFTSLEKQCIIIMSAGTLIACSFYSFLAVHFESQKAFSFYLFSSLFYSQTNYCCYNPQMFYLMRSTLLNSA